MTTTTQRLAVSAPIAYIENAIANGDMKSTGSLEWLLGKVKRMFADPPSNVIQIGDHQPEPVHYDLIQDAVKEEMEKCEFCFGTGRHQGKFSGPGWPLCAHCNGDGKIALPSRRQEGV